MNTATMKILKRPIAEWPLAILATKTNLYDVETDLAALIQRAALLHGYLSHRYNTGGDKGHKASAQQANRELVMVRKALGYSDPKASPMRIQ